MGSWDEAVSRLTHDMDVCDCSCHEEPQHVMHCMPCCETCPNCGQRIRNGMMDLHKVRCKQVALTDDVKMAQRLMGLGFVLLLACSLGCDVGIRASYESRADVEASKKWLVVRDEKWSVTLRRWSGAAGDECEAVALLPSGGTLRLNHLPMAACDDASR